jgi:hypothetical protein
MCFVLTNKKGPRNRRAFRKGCIPTAQKLFAGVSLVTSDAGAQIIAGFGRVRTAAPGGYVAQIGRIAKVAVKRCEFDVG